MCMIWVRWRWVATAKEKSTAADRPLVSIHPSIHPPTPPPPNRSTDQPRNKGVASPGTQGGHQPNTTHVHDPQIKSNISTPRTTTKNQAKHAHTGLIQPATKIYRSNKRVAVAPRGTQGGRPRAGSAPWASSWRSALPVVMRWCVCVCVESSADNPSTRIEEGINLSISNQPTKAAVPPSTQTNKSTASCHVYAPRPGG